MKVTEVEDSIDLVFEVEKRCGVTFDPSGRTEKVRILKSVQGVVVRGPLSNV